MLINSLKWTQLAVAFAATLVLGAGLLLPGAMAIMALPVGFHYILAAVGAILNWRPAMWLACLASFVVALSFTALGGSRAYFAFQQNSVTSAMPTAAVTATGEVIVLDNLPAEALAEYQRRQASIRRRDTFETTLLLLVAAGSWAVVLLHALEWRWMVSGKTVRTD